jgi:hypothetical protein
MALKQKGSGNAADASKRRRVGFAGIGTRPGFPRLLLLDA